MRTVGKIVTAVLVIVFLMALGGNSTDAASFGNNAVKAGVSVVNVAISGAVQLASAAAHIGSSSGKTPSKSTPTTPPAHR